MAAREDVQIRVSANVAEAIRMWKAMEAGPRDMANELEAMGRRGKSSAQGLGSELNKMASQWATLAAKISVARAAISAYMAANRQAQQTQDASSMRLDTLSRQFQVQSGTDSSVMADVRKQINTTTMRHGANMDAGWAGATQLVSSGFSVDEVVNNGGLDEFLEGLNATAATGKNIDPKALAFAVAGHMKATSQDMTAGNVRKLFQDVYSLFKDTNLQTENLARFASEAKVIHDKTGMGNEMLAPFSQLVDVMDESRAATSFRSVALKLATARDNNRAKAGLAELGLSTEDVNFDGESFFDVQERFSKAGQDMSKSDREAAMHMIFGDEGSSAAGVLFSAAGAAETKRRTDRSADPKEYQAAAKVSRESLVADANRADLDEVDATADLNTVTSDVARKRLMTGLRKRGAWTATRALAGTGFDYAIDSGAFTVEEAVDFAMPGYAPWRALGSGDDAEKFKKDITRRGYVEGLDDPKLAPAARSGSPQPPVDVNVNVRLIDQNNLSLPHRAEVHDVGKNSASKQGR